MKKMNRIFKKSRIVFILIIAMAASTFYLLTCSKNEKPEIVGCNSVKYKGITYTNLGCEPGLRSFDISTSQGPASFHIECSKGCISKVTVTNENSKNVTGV